MSSNTQFSPGDYEERCDSPSQILRSDRFKKFLTIYNTHISGTRVAKKEVTVEDVLRDRNLRNRMRHFFRTEMEVRLRGAKQAEAIIRMSENVDKAIAVLDERNEKLQSGDLIEGDIKDEQLLMRRFKQE